MLYYSGNGYTTPSYDFDGLVNGYQGRYETTENKYRWQAGGHNHILVNGAYELPITHHGMSSNISGILYFAEGFLKTSIAHERHNLSIIGASGGIFGKNQVKEAVERFKPSEIRIIPDAGAIENKNVVRTLRATYQLVKSLAPNTPISFTWWGQVAKSDGDIDEISNETFNGAVNLSVKDFFTLASYDDQEYQKHQHKQDFHEPNADNYEAYSNWLDEQELIDELEADLRLQESIESAIDYAIANSIINEGNKGETVDDNQKPKKDVDHWFKPGERHSAIAEGHAKGYQFVLDSSGTGLGKGWNGAQRVSGEPIRSIDKDGNEVLSNPKLWYLDQDYKNKGKDFKDWDVLEPRHGGMYHDTERIEDGKPYLTTKKQEDVLEPPIKGNCNRPGMFGALASLGYNNQQSGGKGSPICSRCPYLGKCNPLAKPEDNNTNVVEGMEGDTGYSGYLGNRSQTLQFGNRILAHPKSLPRLSGETPYDYSNDDIIVDEAGDLLNTKKHQKISQTEWSKAIALALTAPDLEPEEINLLRQLNAKVTDLYMNNDLTRKKRHGLDKLDMQLRLSELLINNPELLTSLANRNDSYYENKLTEL
jgi:hypothetical protein